MIFKDQVDKYEGNIAADGKAYYEASLYNAEVYASFMRDNPLVFSTEKHYLTKIWKHVPAEESSVSAVWYDAGDNVHAICGTHHIVLREGRVLSVDKDDTPAPKTECPDKLFENLKLPSQPGRQFLSKATACAALSEGRHIVGTLDGMLAVVSGEKAFALGACAPHGPVHQIVSTSDQKLAYGVAGDPDDLGTVFYMMTSAGL
jgi:hypothetical protein